MYSRLRSRLTTAFLIAALVACQDSKITGIHVVQSIDIADIDGLVQPGDTVAVHFTARSPGVGTPLAGVELHISVTSGGQVSPETVLTDENGRASARWTLGATEDSQALRVVAPNGRAATTALRPRWAVRSVEFDTTGIRVIVDSARVRVVVRNRLGEIIARDVGTRIETTPDFPGIAVALINGSTVVARGPGFVTLIASSEGVLATPVVLRVAPHLAVLGSFDQAAPVVGGETVTARGYRLDLAGELTMGGVRAPTTLIDTSTLRVVVPPIDTAACRGGAFLTAKLSGGVVVTPGMRVRRAGELTLVPGELAVLGPSRGGCLQIAPIDEAEYALMYVDTRPIVAAEQASFPTYSAERFEFAVGSDPWTPGPATSLPVAQAPAAARVGEPVDVVRAELAASASSIDDIQQRATPWQVGDRASLWVSGVSESGTIVRVSDPFVALVLDREPLTHQQLLDFDVALSAVQRVAVPILRAALSSQTPVTSPGSGQFVIVLSDAAAQGHAGLFFGPAAAVARDYVNVDIITHELAHAWQDRFNRDQCAWDAPFACWSGSTWAVEGGAAFLAQEAERRISAGPLIGWTEPPHLSAGCCAPVWSADFSWGYGNTVWFLRDLMVRAVVAGADEDGALAAVSRGALEGWYGFAPQRAVGTPPREGLAHRLTTLLGTAWNPLDAFETSVWSLGMDQSAAPAIYQFLPYYDYHFGRVGTIATIGTVLAGTILGDTFGHVQILDRGAGGAYRYSVARDGFVWAVGRVR